MIKRKPKVYLDSSVPKAHAYIQRSIFTKSNRQDARHIAYAVYNNMDIIASYNFRHIIRLSTIKKLQSANLILGYHTPEIRSPLELDLWIEDKVMQKIHQNQARLRQKKCLGMKR